MRCCCGSSISKIGTFSVLGSIANVAVMPELPQCLLHALTMSRTLADMEALYDPYLSFDEQHAPREKLMSRFYWGGGLLVLFIGVTYVVAAPRLADGSDGPQTAEYHLNALIYFLLGTWMLSQIRLTSLMTGWRLQNMTVANGKGSPV